VKKPEHEGKARIFYNDIGDYLSRDVKLEIVAKRQSALSNKMEWQPILPDERGDWLNLRSDVFGEFLSLAPDKKYDLAAKSFFVTYSLGIASGRDAWVFNFSQNKLTDNVRKTITHFNEQSEKVASLIGEGISVVVEDAIDYDPKKTSWNRNFTNDVRAGKQHQYSGAFLCFGQYRPFNKQRLYHDKNLTAMQYQIPKLFPTPEFMNLIICVSGLGGEKGNTCLVSIHIPDLNCLDAGTQCFPLYYYEKRPTQQSTLFDQQDDEYTRRDGITDFIHQRCRENYGPKVTKEDIFYYVYGLLHSPDYRTRFSADLKKMLPRLPLVEKPADFWAFSKAGRELAELHLNYEEQPPCPAVTVEGAEAGKFLVDKMRFPDKTDKSVIKVNNWITVSNIPLKAYEYVVNGRSAIEWIMDRYQVRTDKDSGIRNDPNDWAKEHDKPRYILDLLLSIVTVSLETRRIVKGLPGFEEVNTLTQTLTV
jgi:predicted helicase